MPHPNILDPNRAALVVVDIQEGFRAVIPDFAKLAARVAIAVRGFRLLELPILVTEQYPKGLGRTAEEIKQALSVDTQAFEKTAFSSCRASDFVEKLTEFGVKQVVLCGIEVHICVNQTAHDLIERGFHVHLLCDAISSRFEYNRLAGLAKMTRCGAIESSVEMALFELMGDARHPKFKEIQALIK